MTDRYVTNKYDGKTYERCVENHAFCDMCGKNTCKVVSLTEVNSRGYANKSLFIRECDCGYNEFYIDDNSPCNREHSEFPYGEFQDGGQWNDANYYDCLE